MRPGKGLVFTMTILAILAPAAFSENADPAEKWTDDAVKAWFDKKEWLGGWKIQPDASVNKRRLAECYRANPARWNQAFRFLATSDLAKLPLGKQELDGARLFVTVAEYLGKKESDARYESHRKYADIQYVIRGEELIGLTSLDKVTVKTPYDETRDIAF